MVGDSITDEPESGVPTVACTRCGRDWNLDFEVEDLHAGNRAVVQFALDHEQHTGHFPDGEQYLEERPARRWAKVYTRHTDHTVAVHSPTDKESGEQISGE
jgi:hypothetical protein